MEVSVLQKALEEMHKEVSGTVRNRRKVAIATHNEATHIVESKLSVGDFILIRRATDRGHKLSFEWISPMLFDAAHSELVYTVSRFDGSNPQQIHATRMILFSGSLDGTTVPDEVVEFAHRTTARYETIDRLVDLTEDAEKKLMIRVGWGGLPDTSDSTSHKVKALSEDVSEPVAEVLKSLEHNKK